MNNVPHNLDYDSKVQRLKRRYQGLSRVAAAIKKLDELKQFLSNKNRKSL